MSNLAYDEIGPVFHCQSQNIVAMSAGDLARSHIILLQPVFFFFDVLLVQKDLLEIDHIH
jgi:hypothetical protein